jgi:phage terminase large subunit
MATPQPEDLASITEDDLRSMDVGTAQRWLMILEEMPSASSAVVEGLGRETCQEFITEILGDEPSPAAREHGIKVPWTPDQARVMDGVRQHKRVAVYSGNGIGKSYICSRITLWALFGMENTIVITTAPNKRQVESILWGEIRAAVEKSKTELPGRSLLSSIHLGEQWYAMGYTARVRTGDESATGFQGIHSRGRVVVIVDEATDIPEPVWSAIKRITIGERDKIVAIGNPTDPACYFAKIQELKRSDGTPMWHTIVCSGEDHPNVVHDDAEIIPGAVTAEFIQDILDETGSRESAVYRSAVLGLFPTESPDALISLTWLTAAQARYDRILEGVEKRPDSRRGIALGVDVAGSGTDLTIVSAIKDNEWSIPKLTPTEKRKHARAWLQGRDPMEVADLVVQACVELREVRIIVLDDTGIGQGVSARLRQIQREGKLPRYRTMDGKVRDIYIVSKNFGESSNRPRFHLIKDELWWDAREELREGRLIIPHEQEMTSWELPRGHTLRGQITPPIYARTGAGADDGAKIEVYDKRDAHGKKHLTRNLPSKSPDIAHSWILSVHGWLKLRADMSKPLPKSVEEAFNARTQELIAKATRADKKAQTKTKAGKKAGPRSPWIRRR